ncbi:MAG: outer membrane beta-barrel protein [Prevotellaceae bacterium]|nr:outer membrane beta-barrel protein [Candidatus Minthosoma caballi]
MKKFILAAIVAVSAVAANAQTWAGGSLGFGTSHVNGSETTTKTFNLRPEVGMSISDNVDVAIALGYDHANAATAVKNAWTINPYVRYAFVKAGDFSAFVDGGLGYTTTHTNGFDKNLNAVGVNVTPGIAYAVSPKVTLVSHLGDGLYYNHTWQDSYHKNAFGLDLFNAISFGAYVSF